MRNGWLIFLLTLLISLKPIPNPLRGRGSTDTLVY